MCYYGHVLRLGKGDVLRMAMEVNVDCEWVRGRLTWRKPAGEESLDVLWAGM